MTKKTAPLAMLLCLLAGMLLTARAEVAGLALAPDLVLPEDGAALLPEDGIAVDLSPDIEGMCLPDADPSALGAEVLFDMPVTVLESGALDAEALAESQHGAVLSNSSAEGALPDPAGPGEALLAEALEAACAIESPLDGDALFAAYAGRIFGRESAFPPAANASDNTRAQLTPHEQIIYDLLKPGIAEVAEGARASTEFPVPVSTLLGKTAFTAAELGVDMPYPRTPEATAQLSAAWQRQYDYTLDTVAYALWFDCTYELYWLDRYDQPIRASKPPAYIRYDSILADYVVYVKPDACVTFRFPVLDQYADGDIYTLDTALIDRARQASANARAIVGRYADCSDYVKLYGYAMEISRLVDYNDVASSHVWQQEHPQIQDPWKLIWVFDGDSDTDVVCEGFAQAFQYLCELTDFDSGVSCCLATGYAGSQDHSWNLVRMGDGRSYLVDITWMDGEWDDPDGRLADWIADNVGRLFLCGGSGSASGGYAIHNREGGYEGKRVYRSDTLKLLPAALLSLAAERCMPTGFQTLHGDAYCFDGDGKYLTGVKLVEGYGYRFADDGVLEGPLSGWVDLDGERYFFERDGRLHTAHTAVTDPAVPATCTRAGKTEGSHCAVCGAVLARQEAVGKLGHRWGRPEYAWKKGCARVTAKRVCGRDSAHIQTETVRTTAKVTRAATCTAKGRTTYTARFKSAAFTAQQKTVGDIPATGHTPVADAGVPATYTATGLTEGSHCAVCGAVLVPRKTIPRLDCAFHMRRSAAAQVVLGDPMRIVVDGKDVKSFSSSDCAIASVSCRGWITAHRAGRVKIAIRLESGRLLTLKLTVVEPDAPVSVRIAQGDRAALKPGQSLALKAALLPDSARAALYWVSSDPKVASVSREGVVRAVRPGSATVTAVTANGRRASIAVRVSE